jgi:three-Cys-motif partner protein
MPLVRIDLEEQRNDDCLKKCNQAQRVTETENDLCSRVCSVVDGDIIRCVGQWSAQKVYFLNQYFGIFSNGMVKLWKNLNYIEICCGPGRCIAREIGTEFNGTSLSILKHSAYKNINKALFFDSNATVVESLNRRISSLGITNAQAVMGDYYHPEIICDRIRSETNRSSLNLVFIDPTDCSVPFRLLRMIKNLLPNTDFIINVATGTDFNRNIKEVLLKQETRFKSLSKYSRFVGSISFFKDDKIMRLANLNDNLRLRAAFREEYLSNLRKIGFEYFDFQFIMNYYDLLFASSHQKGLDFWKKACKYNHDGQTTLNFSE